MNRRPTGGDSGTVYITSPPSVLELRRRGEKQKLKLKLVDRPMWRWGLVASGSRTPTFVRDSWDRAVVVPTVELETMTTVAKSAKEKKHDAE